MNELDRTTRARRSARRATPVAAAAWVICLAIAAAAPTGARGEEPFVPAMGKFPPRDAGVYYAGELVSVDHVNRRGAIRLLGDGVEDRYHQAPSHRFALLPYGTVRYHGAPAELRDVPIGTVLHGYFTLPPEGDETIPATTGHESKYVPKENHAISLEDDFSFHQRLGRAWEITAVDVEKGTLAVKPTGEPGEDGLAGPQTFEIDPSTRVWQGRRIAESSDLAAGQVVQINLGWAPDWKNGQLHAIDVWIDDESRAVATEAQRRVHLRHQKTRWLAGWVDHVEHGPGGEGIVTFTLFGGMDPSLYDAVRAQAKPGGGGSLAAGEPTLRTWWQEHDSKYGSVVEVREVADPPVGNSGVQVRLRIHELLEGYRPGRVVRFAPNGFPRVKLPPEERVKGLEDR